MIPNTLYDTNENGFFYDEGELWTSIQSGDHTSFRVFYMTYTDILFNYGMKLCADEDIVKDCIQDIFESIWLNKEKIDFISSPKFYLMKSVKNAIYRKIKKAKRFSFIGINESFELSIESHIIKHETKSLRDGKLAEAIKQLTARQKEIIFLRYQENLPYMEISKLMSLNQNSMYKLLHQAIKRLKSSILFGTLFFEMISVL